MCTRCQLISECQSVGIVNLRCYKYSRKSGVYELYSIRSMGSIAGVYKTGYVCELVACCRGLCLCEDGWRQTPHHQDRQDVDGPRVRVTSPLYSSSSVCFIGVLQTVNTLSQVCGTRWCLEPLGHFCVSDSQSSVNVSLLRIHCTLLLWFLRVTYCHVNS